MNEEEKALFGDLRSSKYKFGKALRNIDLIRGSPYKDDFFEYVAGGFSGHEKASIGIGATSGDARWAFVHDFIDLAQAIVPDGMDIDSLIMFGVDKNGGILVSYEITWIDRDYGIIRMGVGGPIDWSSEVHRSGGYLRLCWRP